MCAWQTGVHGASVSANESIERSETNTNGGQQMLLTVLSR